MPASVRSRVRGVGALVRHTCSSTQEKLASTTRRWALPSRGVAPPGFSNVERKQCDMLYMPNGPGPGRSGPADVVDLDQLDVDDDEASLAALKQDPPDYQGDIVWWGTVAQPCDRDLGRIPVLEGAFAAPKQEVEDTGHIARWRKATGPTDHQHTKVP